MADYLLREGMAAANLRSLAAAAGSSDRMLLYYFADKEELLGATLNQVARRLTTMLDDAIPPEAVLSVADLLAAIWTMVRSAALQPYMRLWLELAAASARHQEPQRAVATAIMSGFELWAGSHIPFCDAAERGGLTALLLATIEGGLFLDALGRPDLADAAVARAVRILGQ